jgi:hypothetical protein
VAATRRTTSPVAARSSPQIGLTALEVDSEAPVASSTEASPPTPDERTDAQRDADRGLGVFSSFVEDVPATIPTGIPFLGGS